MKWQLMGIQDYIIESPPSRGAWIEIGWTISISIAHSVAPLAGGVD